MIQRKQTLYLLLAAALVGCTYFFKLWNIDESIDGVASNKNLQVSKSVPLMLLYATIILLNFVAVFYFKNRKRQMLLSVISILAMICFIIFSLIDTRYVGTFAHNTHNTLSVTYSFAVLLPFASIILNLLAILSIRKDEKLVKSLDRLR